MGDKPIDWLQRINNPQEGDRELLNADLRKYYWREWNSALKAYLADPRDPYKAEYFLMMHPANQRQLQGHSFHWFHENLWWCFVKVDPKTKHIETRKNPDWKKNKKGKHPVDKSRNTETNVWMEWGPHCDDDENFPNGIGSHDHRVDTGGRTFEDALVNLAHNIWKLYGDLTSVPHDAKLAKADRW